MINWYIYLLNLQTWKIFMRKVLKMFLTCALGHPYQILWKLLKGSCSIQEHRQEENNIEQVIYWDEFKEKYFDFSSISRDLKSRFPNFKLFWNLRNHFPMRKNIEVLFRTPYIWKSKYLTWFFNVLVFYISKNIFSWRLILCTNTK